MGVVVLALGLNPATGWGQWTQWGGPDRNFSVADAGLAKHWPASGPNKLWERELGDGYSTILVDDGVLYTMYRTGQDEFIIAMDAATGKTIWEHRAEAPVTADMSSHGPGPYATPLIIGSRLYAVGTRSVIHCLDKKTGRVIWKHDMMEEFDALLQGFGFSSSPIAYRDTIILPVGRKVSGSTDDDKKKRQQQSLMAFDQKSGSLVWENLDFGITEHTSTYSSPILIRFNGQDQLVLFMASELAGLDPTNGQRIWGVPHRTQYDENIATPVWNGKDTLFCSAAYDSGARAVRLTAKNGTTTAEELWYSRKMRILHGNAVRIGDHMYASSGDFGPTFFMGMELATGKVAWRERGFKKATCLSVGGMVIILAADGTLALATATPKGFTLHCKSKVAGEFSWAPPTLVGKTLYVRDRKHIMAIDLG